MPRLIHQNPAYRKHKASGQAIVTLDGNDFYLGPHGTKASRAESPNGSRTGGASRAR